MRHAWVLVWLFGCGSNAAPAPEPPPPPRGIRPSQGQVAPSQATPPTPSVVPAQAPTATQEPAAEPNKAKNEPAAEPEKKRDYEAELTTAVGTPTDCLKPREGPDSPSEIRVELEAHFLETGAMSRGYARSSQLDPEELTCLRSRLEAVRLQSPIEEAPRTVHATLSFKLKKP